MLKQRECIAVITRTHTTREREKKTGVRLVKLVCDVLADSSLGFFFPFLPFIVCFCVVVFIFGLFLRAFIHFATINPNYNWLKMYLNRFWCKKPRRKSERQHQFQMWQCENLRNRNAMRGVCVACVEVNEWMQNRKKHQPQTKWMQLPTRSIRQTALTAHTLVAVLF